MALRRIMIFPMMFIMAVITNKMRAMAKSEDNFRPSASPNWFATMLAIELPVS